MHLARTSEMLQGRYPPQHRHAASAAVAAINRRACTAMRLVNLEADALVLVAECVVLRGEGYWLASVCRVTCAAVRIACRGIGVSAPNNHIDTIFASLARMHHALTMTSVRTIVLAQADAANVTL